MNINKIFTIYFSVLVLSIFAVLLSFKFFIIMPKEFEEAKVIQQQQINQLNYIFEKNSEKNKTFLDYYSTWDQTYNYFFNKNENYYLHYDDSMFQKIDINTIIFVDQSYKILHTKHYDQKTNKSFKVDNKILLSDIGEMYPDHDKSTNLKSGYLYLNGEYMYYNSQQARKTNGNGENIGAIIFLHSIKEELFIDIKKSMNIDVKINNNIEPNFNYIALNETNRFEKEYSSIKKRAIINTEGEVMFILDIKLSEIEFTPMFSSNFFILLFSIIFFVLCLKIVVNKTLIKPVRDFNTLIRYMTQNKKLKIINHKSNISEYDETIQNFNNMTKELAGKEEKITHLTNTDNVTQLKNKSYFEQNIEELIELAKNNNYYIGYILLNVDNFKEYRNILGGNKADETLNSISSIIEHSFLYENGIVTRYKSKEFLVAVATKNKNDLFNFCESIKGQIKRDRIETPAEQNEDYITLSSGGVYKKLNKHSDITNNELLNGAETNVLIVKKKSKNDYLITEI